MKKDGGHFFVNLLVSCHFKDAGGLFGLLADAEWVSSLFCTLYYSPISPKPGHFRFYSDVTVTFILKSSICLLCILQSLLMLEWKGVDGDLQPVLRVDALRLTFSLG